MKTSTVRIAALAGSVALALTGCAGESRAGDSKVTTPAGSVATSAPSPATTRPATKAPPTQSSRRASEEAAAIAVVRKYVAEYNEALQSGSTTAFRATFKKSCAFCFGDAKIIDETFRNNQRFRGLHYGVASPVVTFNGVTHGDRLIFVEGQLSQAGGQVLAASGAVVHNVTPSSAIRVLWEVKPERSPVIVRSENR